MSGHIYVKGVQGRTVYIPNTRQVIPVEGVTPVVPTVTIIRALQSGDLVELELNAPEADEPKSKTPPKKSSE